ncbi:kinesin-like protein KIF12 [Pleurodeles waltl]|uniref:kinesin-like protein KIF12 n=1 Tax=Pleurodeles waltl TaxID=8319 RepID=UPI0037098BBF
MKLSETKSPRGRATTPTELLQRHSESREGGSGELTSGGPPGLEQGLYGMLQEFLSENEKLRRENLVLMNSNNSAKNTTRALSHENDQLVRKLEELERVLSSSPTVSSRSFSGNSQSLRISSPDTSGHYLPKLPSICSCHCCHLCHQYCPSAAPPVPQLLPDLPPIEMFTGANSGQPQHNDLDPTQGLRTHRSAPHRSQQQQPALKTKCCRIKGTFNSTSMESVDPFGETSTLHSSCLNQDYLYCAQQSQELIIEMSSSI